MASGGGLSLGLRGLTCTVAFIDRSPSASTESLASSGGASPSAASATWQRSTRDEASDEEVHNRLTFAPEAVPVSDSVGRCRLRLLVVALFLLPPQVMVEKRRWASEWFISNRSIHFNHIFTIECKKKHDHPYQIGWIEGGGEEGAIERRRRRRNNGNT